MNCCCYIILIECNWKEFLLIQLFLSLFVIVCFKVTTVYKFEIKVLKYFAFSDKRTKQQEQLLKCDLTWKKIIKFVDDNLDKKEYQTVNGDLKTILQAAKQIGRS